MSQMTGAAYFADFIKASGLTHLFHVPIAFYRTLALLEGSGVRRVLTHGEKAAAYMADGYARASGRPGLCLAQSIGAANLAAGMADAFMAGSPVVAMTGALNPEHRFRYAYQEFEHVQFAGVTKWRAEIDRAGRVPDLLRSAWQTAVAGRPGPVHLDVRDEAMNGEADLPALTELLDFQVSSVRPAPSTHDIGRAVELLEQAKFPVIVAGGGAIASGAWEELQAFAESLTIPVATSLNGKGAFPAFHALSVGPVGRYGRWTANRLATRADVVLFIGTRAGGMTTLDWRVPPTGSVKTIQININADDIGRTYPVDVALLGDAKATLQRMCDAVPRRPANKERIAQVYAARSGWEQESQPLLTSEALPIRPERLCYELNDWLPRDAVVMADTGNSSIWTGSMINLKRTGNNYIRSAGSLGWGLPGAIGAQCALPDRPVVLFTGDGGLWYHIAELETAARHNIPVIVLVNDNHALAQEIPPIAPAYGSEPLGEGMELALFRDVNLANLATEMGCYAERIERPDEIGPALQRARQSGRPSVIDVVTDMNVVGPANWKG